MKWAKTDGNIIDARDNKATEDYLNALGYKKIGSDPVEIGEPDEATDADGQPNPPVAGVDEIGEDDMPVDNREEQSIDPDDVGEMPKEILGG
jgi:hypothetical protein